MFRSGAEGWLMVVHRGKQAKGSELSGDGIGQGVRLDIGVESSPRVGVEDDGAGRGKSGEENFIARERALIQRRQILPGLPEKGRARVDRRDTGACAGTVGRLAVPV